MAAHAGFCTRRIPQTVYPVPPRVFCGRWRRPRKKTVLHYLCSSAKKFAGNDSRLQRENIRFNPLRGFDALLERGDQRHAHAVLSRVDAVGGA